MLTQSGKAYVRVGFFELRWNKSDSIAGRYFESWIHCFYASKLGLRIPDPTEKVPTMKLAPKLHEDCISRLSYRDCISSNKAHWTGSAQK
jgi:hypothetical protein